VGELVGIHVLDARTAASDAPDRRDTAAMATNLGTLTRSCHLNLAEFSRESARWGDAGRLSERDGYLLFATGTEFPVLCNGVVRLDDHVSAGVVLDAADRWFGDLGRGYTVMIRDLDVDQDLEVEAKARGMLEVGNPPEMVCRSRLDDRPPPPGAQLRWVVDEEGIRDFIAVNTGAYGTYGMPADVMPAMIAVGPRFLEPHVQTVVAYLDERPVAAAQTVLSHGIAGVYWVGTVEHARGTGLGEVVTRAVTNRAFDLGARANTLQASPMGEPIYLRMGYETIYRYRSYTRFEPALPG
jgi:hypothetical protein